MPPKLAEMQPDKTVRTYFDCPPEAPTTRAFAGILAEGLAGASAAEVLAVPDDLYSRMGLAQAISPLRVRGGTSARSGSRRHWRPSAGRRRSPIVPIS